MASKAKSFDIWIVDGNKVYQGVPYTVVLDWIQQGRLLETDRVRLGGTKDWTDLGQMPDLVPYLPQADTMRAEDQAEALEPVELDFAWKPHHDDEEGDVDMIPLIDVSLVLLIFFMMTASVAASVSILTPTATNPTLMTNDPRMIWIGIDKIPGRDPVYSIGKGEQGPAPEDQNLTEAEVVKHLAKKLDESGGAEVRIRAHKQLPYSVVKRLTLQVERYRPKVQKVYSEVSVSKS